MPRIGVACPPGGDVAKAEALAEELQLPRVGDDPGQSFFDYLLQLDDGVLALHPAPPNGLQHGPVSASLDDPDVLRRSSGGRRNPLARALGMYARHKPTTVLDACAGLGRDAAVMAGLGLQVSLLEREPVIHALLANAVQRLQSRQPDSGLHLLGREDALTYLPTVPQSHDVVYLDPMFPARGKHALARKELQTLRRLLDVAETDDVADAARLLSLALACARQRVVVKRHPRSPHLGNMPPAYSVSASRVRYDIYLAPAAS